MRVKEYEFVCTSCSCEFTIVTSEDEVPEHCPFCSEDLENESSDEDYDSEEE